MDIGSLVETGLDPQVFGTAADNGHGCLDGLFHHVTEMPGQRHIAFARHQCGFDAQ